MRKSYDTDCLQYMREIASIPLLTAEEEQSLAERIKNGDTEARELMIRSNLRLVVKIAMRLLGRGIALADLIADGNMGLIRAAESYDIRFKTRFSTYASYWIKQSIKRGIVNHAKLVRVPGYMVEWICKFNVAKAAMTVPGMPEPSEIEIAKSIGLNRKRLKLLKKAVALQQHVFGPNSTGELPTIEEVIVDPHKPTISESDIDEVTKLVERLPKREAEIIKMRFGIDCESLTLRRIGETMGLTRERVRQIEVVALKRLREWIDESTAV